MKTLLIAVNSKFIHSALAPWYLKYCCGEDCGEVKVKEFTINDSPERALSAVYLEKPDVAAFSCYIWNIAFILELAANLRKVLPGVITVFGGPEVSYDSERLLRLHPEIDYIIKGEGEEAFSTLLRRLSAFSGYASQERQQGRRADRRVPGLGSVNGLTYREGNTIVSNDVSIINVLDEIPSPYTEEMLSGAENRIVYFEASRGCPFSCSYCLSSAISGVRYFSTDRVKRELSLLVSRGVKQVKFVDRTFNCNRERAKEIFSFVSALPGDTNFHFEAAADLFDQDMLEILSQAPPGRIQFEIGIQSTNPSTLQAVARKTDLEKVYLNFNALKATGRMHLHLDLIAGLPNEGLVRFRESFDTAYRLRPHQLQLGFLKLLKGSRLRSETVSHGYSFRENPPYELLYNNYISYEEILELKAVEDSLEKFHNSGRFVRSLDYLVNGWFSTPYDFFLRLSAYVEQKGPAERPLAARELYRLLYDFSKSILPEENLGVLQELLKLDYLCSDGSGSLPPGLERLMLPGFREQCFKFLKNKENIRLYLPAYEALAPKQVFKTVHFEAFKYDVTCIRPGRGGAGRETTILLFDYSVRNKVTGLFGFSKVNIE